MDLVFGGNFDTGAAASCWMSSAMGLYLSAATLNQALLAQGRARQAATCCELGSARASWRSCSYRRWTTQVLSVEVGLLAGAAACARSFTRCTVAPEPWPSSGDPRPLQRSPASANGGYTCGVVASLLGADVARVHCAPPPIGQPAVGDPHGRARVAAARRAARW